MTGAVPGGEGGVQLQQWWISRAAGVYVAVTVNHGFVSTTSLGSQKLGWRL